jgi:hypothetical protein
MNKPSTAKTNAKKKKITILGCLANESTGKSRKLLKKYGQEDASNHQDLEFKLSQLYKSVDDKKQLEKEFAEIHPHRDFILKYAQPKIEKIEEPVSTSKEVETIVVSTPEVKQVEETVIQAQHSNCSGNSCSCGCSGFDGAKPSQSASEVMPSGAIGTDRLIVLGMFGFVSILALVLITKNK